MDLLSVASAPLTAAQKRAVNLMLNRGAASGLRYEDACIVVRQMRPRRYPAEAVILQAGEHLDDPEMALVLSGEVRIENESSSGDRMVLSIYGPGALFGEMSLIDGNPLCSTCTAATDVVVGLLSRSGLERLVAEHPEVAMRLLMTVTRCVVKKLRDTSKRLHMMTRVGNAQQHELDAMHTVNQRLLDHIDVMRRESVPESESTV